MELEAGGRGAGWGRRRHPAPEPRPGVEDEEGNTHSVPIPWREGSKLTVESVPKSWIWALLVLHLQVPAQSKPPASAPLPQVPALKRAGPELRFHCAELPALDPSLPALSYLLLLWGRCQNQGGTWGGSSSALGGCGRADRAGQLLAGHGDHLSSWSTQGPLPLPLIPASPNS